LRLINMIDDTSQAFQRPFLPPEHFRTEHKNKRID
jgi:hypothetical protein